MSNRIRGFIVGDQESLEFIFNHVKESLSLKMKTNLMISKTIHDNVSNLISNVRKDIEEYGEVVTEELIESSEKEVDVLIKDLLKTHIGGKIMLEGKLISVNLKSEDLKMIEKSLLAEDEHNIFFNESEPTLKDFYNNIVFGENEISDGIGSLKISNQKMEFFADLPYEKAEEGILYKSLRNSLIEISKNKEVQGMLLIETSAGIKEDLSFGEFSTLISAAKMKNVGSHTLDKLWSAMNDENKEVVNKSRKMKLG